MSSTTDRIKSPTLADVARLSGLSTATVSLALNRSADQCPLRDGTRLKAVQAAERLGYKPNWRAQSLASGRTKMVGFLYARSVPLVTGVNEEVMEGLVDEFGTQGYTQMLISIRGQDTPAHQLVSREHLDGVITLFPGGNELYQLSQIHGLPTIQVNDLSVPHLPAVLADDRKGAGALTRHLLELGHRDIAFVTEPQRWHYSVTHRREGFEQAMQDAGMGAHTRMIAAESMDQAIATLLEMVPRPTAIIADDHVQAIDILHVLWRRGISVPGQMSVAAFNNVFPTEKTMPPLTVMAVPGRAIGHAAAAQLVRWMTGGTPPTENRTWFDEQLVVRESTAPPHGNQ